MTGELSANTAQEPTSLETACTPMAATSELEPKPNVAPSHLGLVLPTHRPPQAPTLTPQWSELSLLNLSAVLSFNGMKSDKMEAAHNLSKSGSSKEVESSHQEEFLHTATPMPPLLNALFLPNISDLHHSSSLLVMKLSQRSPFNTLHGRLLTRLIPTDTMLPLSAPSPQRFQSPRSSRPITPQLMSLGPHLMVNKDFNTS